MVNHIKRVFEGNSSREVLSQSDTPVSSPSLSQLIELTKQAEANKHSAQLEIIERLIVSGLSEKEANRLLDRFAASASFLSEFN